MSDFSTRAGIAVVTGGTGGVGSAICRQLARAGSRVALTYRSDADGAQRLRAELGEGSRADRLDLTDTAAVRGLLDEVAETDGGIHTLVHAAGPHVPMRHLSRVDPDLMRRQLDEDVAGFFALMHAALPHLRRTQGSVVVVTTAATTRFPKRDGLSSGPKGAVEALARGFASEEGRYGVRVNCVGPGMLTDGMASRLIASGELDEDALAITRRNIPLGRFGSAQDIAEVVGFLASDRAGFITGQKIDVDGGYGI